MAVTTGWDADVMLTASPSITVGGSPVACTDSGDHITYTVTDPLKKFFDKRQAVTIQQSANGSSGWTTVAATEYLWQPCGGKLVFTPARQADTNGFIRINAGYYFNYTSVGDANEWALQQSSDVVDTTPFQVQWRQKTPTIKDANIKFHTFKPDNTFSKELGNLMAVILYVDKSAGARFECFAWLSSDGLKTAATGVFEQDISLEAEEAVYFYAS